MNVKECQLCIHKTRTSRTSSINLILKNQMQKLVLFVILTLHWIIDHLIRKLLTKGVFIIAIIALALAAHTKKRTKQFSRLALQKNVEKCRNVQ